MKLARKLFSGLCEWLVLIIFSAVLIVIWPLIRMTEDKKDE